MFRCNNQICSVVTFELQVFDKFKRSVIFEVIVIDTMKPTGQCSLEDFRTLIICFNSVNSIMKKKPARIKRQGLSAGVDSRPPKIPSGLSLAFHYFKISRLM